MSRPNLSVVSSISVAMIFLFSLTGCLGRSAPAVSYYSLMTMEQLGGVQQMASYPELHLGLGPVTIPDSLKRSQIATRTSGNLYSFNEFNRWAGILEEDFASVLGENLGALLNTEKVAFFPWMNHFRPDYRIVVDVILFDGDLEGEAMLKARWAVTSADGKKFLAGGKSAFQNALEKPSYPALIKAESQLIASLSKQIADAIITIEK